jgi:hypothetical protein
MSHEMTNKITTGCEEQISIFLRQSRQGVECETIHTHIDGSGETGASIETDPVEGMVIRHDLLNYPNTL